MDTSLAVTIQRSWRSAFALAAGIELGALALVALIFASPSGADNPLPWLLAWLLQFPSSLLVTWLMTLIPEERNLNPQTMTLYAVVLFVGQTLVLAVWIRKPWRRSSRPT